MVVVIKDLLSMSAEVTQSSEEPEDPETRMDLEDPDSASALWKAQGFFPLIATDTALVTKRWSQISSVRKKER